MNDEKKDEEVKNENEEKPDKKFFYIALGCLIAAAVTFALTLIFTFTVKGIAIYFLIANMVCELASLSFLNAQKQRYGEGKAAKIMRVINYVLIIIAAAIFVAGTAVSGATSE